MSLEEVEPLAEMEEKELSSYGATELMEYNDEKTNDARHRGGQTHDFVENRCWLIWYIKATICNLEPKSLPSYLFVILL